jgi:hypothetical protein
MPGGLMHRLMDRSAASVERRSAEFSKMKLIRHFIEVGAAPVVFAEGAL